MHDAHRVTRGERADEGHCGGAIPSEDDRQAASIDDGLDGGRRSTCVFLVTAGCGHRVPGVGETDLAVAEQRPAEIEIVVSGLVRVPP
jgi:hypothetical protein